MADINIALLSYKFMGKAHSNAYRQVSRFFPGKLVPRLKVICGRDRAAVEAAARQFGWEEVETDWRRAVERKDIDVVDVSTPGYLHREMAIAAARAGKHVICEKPLANTLAEAKAMLRAVDRAGVKHMVMHNYRKVPAIAFAKKLIENGRLGNIYHYHGAYLQDWIMDPQFPLVWRFDKKLAGSGALGDIGSHAIDLAQYLNSDIRSVTSHLTTFIKERPLVAPASCLPEGVAQASCLPKDVARASCPPESSKHKAQLRAKAGRERAKAARGTGRVTVDDDANFLARFANASAGVFESSRFCGGRRNYNTFQIYGSKGSLAFNIERLNELEFYDRIDAQAEQAFKTILVTESVHPYVGAWWPPGHIVGYEHTFVHAVHDFLVALEDDTMPSPNFADGVKNQAVIEAVERSGKSGRWEKVVTQ